MSTATGIDAAAWLRTAIAYDITKGNAMRACAVPPVFIPLEQLAVCIGCDVCFPFDRRSCPKCGGQNIMAIAKWLNRLAPAERTTR